MEGGPSENCLGERRLDGSGGGGRGGEKWTHGVYLVLLAIHEIMVDEMWGWGGGEGERKRRLKRDHQGFAKENQLLILLSFN